MSPPAEAIRRGADGVAVRPARPVPWATVEPIEIVAADLRRLADVVTDPGRSALVRLSARLAYLDRLRAACCQLEVAHSIDRLRGLHRRFEVQRCERELARRGLAL